MISSREAEESAARSTIACTMVLDWDTIGEKRMSLVEAMLRAKGGPVRMVIVSRRCSPAVAYLSRLHVVAGVVLVDERHAGEFVSRLRAVLGSRAESAQDVADSAHRLYAESTAFFKILSRRQLSLLPWFARGWPDKTIGGALGLSPCTVKRHRHGAMAALELGSSHELRTWAASTGF